MRKKNILFFMIIIIAALCMFDLYISNARLQISNYQIYSTKIKNSFRILQISDLHSAEFGQNNVNLINAVSEAEPDLILITGDLINNKDDIDIYYVENIIGKLCEIAPVYISFGNQEDSVQNEGKCDLYQLYTASGATVLDSSYQTVLVNGQEIRLGGIYGYCEPIVYAKDNGRESESEFLKDFQATDHYTILMCHMPYCWLEEDSLCEWNIDVVFAGHVHGGQIRIPIIGGLWAPDQGWFPGQECGVYGTTEDDWAVHRDAMKKYAEIRSYDDSYYTEAQAYEPSYLILSRGLGNTDWVPRFNNIPEIVVVDFSPARG